MTSPVGRAAGFGVSVPPLREQPDQQDRYDADRVRLLRERWDAQSGVLLPYHRQIEENVRMVAGRQWDVWSEPLRRYVDVAQYLTESERFWLQRPVFNLLFYWYQLTHARLTENPPSPIFQPATSDRLDRALADCLTPVWRTLWSETKMEEKFAQASAWQAIAGSVYIETGVDFTRGKRRAVALTPDDAGMIDPEVFDGSTAFDGMEDADVAEPSTDEYDGCLVPRVRNPLEVRAEWGADIPWERKRWIITRSYLTLDEAREIYGVEIAPTPDIDASANILQRLLFSSGYYDGSSPQLSGTLYGSDIGGGRQVAIDTMWEAPSDLSPETEESPGGRLLIVAGNQVLHDSPRPYRTKCAGPIRRADFVEVAGRGGFGSTPLEVMTPAQKAYNRGWAQILQHRNLCTNPTLLYDADAGIADEFEGSLVGAKIGVEFTQQNGGKPAFYLTPPPLSADVWRTQAMLLEFIQRVGSLAGAEGAPQTDDPSGELVSQLRFNSDRPIAIAARSMAHCMAGVAEDWIAILPTIWPDERTLEYAGEDELFRNVTLTPDLWSGSVNVRPDLENARMETPESKEQRALAKYQAGLFGPPGTPEASAKFAEYARVDKLESLFGPQRTVDTDMVRWVMSRLLEGVPFDPSMLREQFDYAQWTRVLREHMASPEFNDATRTPPEIQQQFDVLWTYVQTAQIAQQQTVMQRQAPLMAEQAATQGAIAKIAQLHGPQDPAKPPQSGDTSSPDAKAA